jgi:site-specific recombinase XerD
MLALRVSDVMEDNGVVKDRISIREKETEKSKAFPICKNARKAIQEYVGSIESDRDLSLFRSRRGNDAITRVLAYRILIEAARTVGIKERIATQPNP